jgi:hypothetical protein
VAEAATDAAAAGVIVNQSVVSFRIYRISGSTLTRKCLPTYMYLYLCICECLFVAQIKVSRGGFICATNRNLQIHK